MKNNYNSTEEGLRTMFMQTLRTKGYGYLINLLNQEHEKVETQLATARNSYKLRMTDLKKVNPSLGKEIDACIGRIFYSYSFDGTDLAVEKIIKAKDSQGMFDIARKIIDENKDLPYERYLENLLE